METRATAVAKILCKKKRLLEELNKSGITYGGKWIDNILGGGSQPQCCQSSSLFLLHMRPNMCFVQVQHNLPFCTLKSLVINPGSQTLHEQLSSCPASFESLCSYAPRILLLHTIFSYMIYRHFTPPGSQGIVQSIK